MVKDPAELRKEALRLLGLADAENDPAVRNAFIQLALQNADLAFAIETRARAKNSKP